MVRLLACQVEVRFLGLPGDGALFCASRTQLDFLSLSLSLPLLSKLLQLLTYGKPTSFATICAWPRPIDARHLGLGMSRGVVGPNGELSFDLTCPAMVRFFRLARWRCAFSACH